MGHVASAAPTGELEGHASRARRGPVVGNRSGCAARRRRVYHVKLMAQKCTSGRKDRIGNRTLSAQVSSVGARTRNEPRLRCRTRFVGEFSENRACRWRPGTGECSLAGRVLDVLGNSESHHRAGHPARLATLRTFRRTATSRSFCRLAAKNRPNNRPVRSFSSRARQLFALLPSRSKIPANSPVATEPSSWESLLLGLHCCAQEQ
jgi:hypothetical protein